MGRPLNPRFLGANAVHQIQSTTWGAPDTGSTPGFLAGQNSNRRFRATTVHGTSLTTLVNGAGNLVQGTSFVKAFPEGTQPTQFATGSATLMAVGNANVVVGGANYSVGDYVTLVGGTATAVANVQVLAVSGAPTNAAVRFSSPVNQGPGTQKYTALPANANLIGTVASTGNGAGAVVSQYFGVDTAAVATGGAGYNTAVFVVQDSIVAPVFVQPAVSGGAVTTGAVTVTTPGAVTSTNVTIENENGTTEYVKTITMNYLLTFQGNVYKWLPKGGTPPSDYPSLGVKLAYLDTL